MQPKDAMAAGDNSHPVECGLVGAAGSRA